MDFAERAARNEELIHEVNEQIQEGAKLHGIDSAMPLHCECGQATCLQKVELRPSRYEGILSNRHRFVVAPGHEQPEVERIGEARAQIDKDHPQQQHRENAETSQ